MSVNPFIACTFERVEDVKVGDLIWGCHTVLSIRQTAKRIYFTTSSVRQHGVQVDETHQSKGSKLSVWH